jgi:hypothetical protein
VCGGWQRVIVYSICKGVSVCPVVNGSAVEGPERLDIEIGGIRITVRYLRQGMRVLASVVQEQWIKFTRVGGRQLMGRASLSFVGHRNFGGPFQVPS